jgi:hypothetical protein
MLRQPCFMYNLANGTPDPRERSRGCPLCLKGLCPAHHQPDCRDRYGDEGIYNAARLRNGHIIPVGLAYVVQKNVLAQTLLNVFSFPFSLECSPWLALFTGSFSRAAFRALPLLVLPSQGWA